MTTHKVVGLHRDTGPMVVPLNQANYNTHTVEGGLWLQDSISKVPIISQHESKGRGGEGRGEEQVSVR